MDTRWTSYYKENEQRTDIDLTKSLYQTIASVAAEIPDETALEFGKVMFSYRRLLEEIDRAAASFLAIGISEGDRVALCDNGVPSTIVSVYALNKIGAVTCMVLHGIPRKGFTEQMVRCGCRFAIMPADLFDNVSGMIRDTGIDTVILTRVGDYFTFWDKINLGVRMLMSSDKYRYDPALMPDGFRLITWDKMMKEERDTKIISERERDVDSVSFLFFTGIAVHDSQSTVCISDRAINSEASLGLFMIGSREGGQNRRRVMSFVEKAFVYGFCTGIHMPLAAGHTLVLCAAHDRGFPVPELNFYKPDVFVGYPSIVSGFIGNSRVTDAALQSLRTILSGGDLFGGASLNKVGSYLAERGSSAKIYQTYGIAETMSVCIYKDSNDDDGRLLGIPLPGVAVKVCERDTMGEMPIGRKGEICVLTPARINGYLDDEDADNRTIRHQPDGRVWIMTGDIGHIDERGMIYFDGNSGRTFERLGTQIYPQLIESEIKNVYGVTDVCVVPVDNEDGSRDIVAVVVPVSDYLFNNDRLRDIKSSIELECSLMLPPPMCPDQIEFRAYIPKRRYGSPDYEQIAKSVAENRLKITEKNE